MKRLFVFCLILSLLLMGCTAPQETNDPNELVIHFIDVGHADCILMMVGETTVMIDGGNTQIGRASCRERV